MPERIDFIVWFDDGTRHLMDWKSRNAVVDTNTYIDERYVGRETWEDQKELIEHLNEYERENAK